MQRLVSDAFRSSTYREPDRQAQILEPGVVLMKQFVLRSHWLVQGLTRNFLVPS